LTGNTLGQLFRVTTWGESHGKVIGCVIDGCPAGVSIDERSMEVEMKRDVPYKLLSRRFEENSVEILSGVFQGKTTGTPISLMVKNGDVLSSTYSENRDIPRPGHADLTYRMKYGHVDWRGGSRASGRTWTSLIAAGSIAKQLCSQARIEFKSKILRLGQYEVKDDVEKIIERISNDFNEDQEPTGGTIEVTITGLPEGIGAPMFNRFQADIGHGILNIPGIRSFILGKGPLKLKASGQNDGFGLDGKEIIHLSNNASGVLGGITTGEDLVFRADVKPTPSTSVEQRSLDLSTMEEVEISSRGRFDINYTPRVLVLAEAVSAMVTVDHLMISGRLPHDSVIPQEGRLRYSSNREG
jgi:chorismate synthase